MRVDGARVVLLFQDDKYRGGVKRLVLRVLIVAVAMAVTRYLAGWARP